MTNEKVVVVLLLITIILSVVSVVVALGVGGVEEDPQVVSRILEDDSSAQISFEIVDSGSATGGTG